MAEEKEEREEERTTEALEALIGNSKEEDLNSDTPQHQNEISLIFFSN